MPKKYTVKDLANSLFDSGSLGGRAISAAQEHQRQIDAAGMNNTSDTPRKATGNSNQDAQSYFDQQDQLKKRRGKMNTSYGN